jgi:hypothetical protein
MQSMDTAVREAGSRLGELGATSLVGLDAAMAIALAFAIVMLMLAPLACSGRR